ncbi:NLR, CARD domain-containing protein 3 [Aphanomyces cochlioides]|nr:NLR, CARD domain-containing protein 3 [Aphanomyces cochlioides]
MEEMEEAGADVWQRSDVTDETVNAMTLTTVRAAAAVVERDLYIRVTPRQCKKCRALSESSAATAESCSTCKRRRRQRERSIWETASLNRSWEIPDAVKMQLPLVARDKAPELTPCEMFLQWSNLQLPPPPSATASVRPLHAAAASATASDAKKQVKRRGLVRSTSLLIDAVDTNMLLETQRNKYFGVAGVTSSRAIYAKLASQRYLQSDGTTGLVDKFKLMLASQNEPSPDAIGAFNSNEAFTARHKFLSLCLDHELPPCLRLIIRHKVSAEINVSHMSMGDALAQVFCQCLVELPMVLALNMRNNRLTDAGIQAVVDVVARKSDVCSLDVSENKVDGAASVALASYLSTPRCGLTTLALSQCDIDDNEVLGFAKALCANKTLHNLDLSRNFIGSNEALNVVQPDLTTGGEALAEMLTTNNHLTSLNLSWNFLRLHSAVELGRALALNNSLKTLNLSYNAFGNDGAQAIGCALQHNMCLETLDLSQNNIPSRAAFVIAQSLHANDSLATLLMDGNPLGRVGGQTLLQAISTAGHRNLHISLAGCNFEIDDHGSFDPLDATGSYDLDMTLPYERAIALELLRLANTQNGCKFLSFVHVVEKAPPRQIPCEKRRASHARAQLLSKRTTHDVLRGRMASDRLEALFKTLDADGSGTITAEELRQGMRTQGLHLSLQEAEQMVARYDLDGSGTIELAEFVDLMSQYYFDDKPLMEWIDTSTGLPLEIPQDGRLQLNFLDLHIPADADETVSKAGIQLLLENIATDPNQVNLIDLAKHNMHLRQTEAQLLLDALVKKIDVVDALVMLLPQVVDANHACPLIELNTDNYQRLRLQALLREMYGPIVGLATGHYALDLGDAHDRATLKKMIELNNKLMTSRREKNLKDTSQHENHSCFRNERLNHHAFVITPAFYDDLPKYGALEFDFVQLSRPIAGILPMSDNRFKQLIARLYLDDAALSLSRSDLATPATPATAARQLNVHVYNYLLELQHGQVLVGDLHNRDIAASVPNAKDHSGHLSARRLLMELQALFCTRWLTVRQAMLILSRWPPSFGSTRVDAALMLFDRILDLYNFTQIFAALDDEQCAQVIYRLGWLNLWSPLNPELYYELDLTIYEQREVTKVLVQLALDEPGENWQNATFGWDRDSPMPGWVLNMSWLTPGNFPVKGYLRLEYYSGADKGCSPVWPTRRASAQNVLAELPHQFEDFLAHREKIRRAFSRRQAHRDSKSAEKTPPQKQIKPLPPPTNT